MGIFVLLRKQSQQWLLLLSIWVLAPPAGGEKLQLRFIELALRLNKCKSIQISHARIIRKNTQ